MAEDKKAKARQLNINVNTYKGSVYSQIVGVTVTDFDITLEFVYVHPREDIQEAQVVSRVTMPRTSAEDLSKAILDTIKLHEAKKKGERND